MSEAIKMRRKHGTCGAIVYGMTDERQWLRWQER